MEENLSTVVTPGKPKKGASGKIIAAIVGVVLLAGGVIAGILLVKQQQELRERAQEGAVTLCGKERSWVDIDNELEVAQYPGPYDHGYREGRVYTVTACPEYLEEYEAQYGPVTIATPTPTPTAYPVCSGDPCTDCILNVRPDILPFYQSNGWDIGCSNQEEIIINWCGPTVDPKGCQKNKENDCPAECGIQTAAQTQTTQTQTTTTASPSPTATTKATTTPTPTAKATTKPLASGESLPTSEDLPVSGISLPTVIGTAAGVILLIGALLLAL